MGHVRSVVAARRRHGVLAIAILISIAASVWRPAVADALGNRKQVLIGGGQGTGTTTLMTAPGLARLYEAAQIPAYVRMPRGTLSALRVSCVPFGTPPSVPADLQVIVSLNGQDTDLQCSCGLDQGFSCEKKDVRVTLDDGALFAVKIISTLPSGDFGFTYSLILK